MESSPPTVPPRPPTSSAAAACFACVPTRRCARTWNRVVCVQRAVVRLVVSDVRAPKDRILCATATAGTTIIIHVSYGPSRVPSSVLLLFFFLFIIRLPLRAADNPNISYSVSSPRVRRIEKPLDRRDGRYAMAFEAPQQVSSGGLCALYYRRVCPAPDSVTGFWVSAGECFIYFVLLARFVSSSVLIAILWRARPAMEEEERNNGRSFGARRDYALAAVFLLVLSAVPRSECRESPSDERPESFARNQRVVFCFCRILPGPSVHYAADVDQKRDRRRADQDNPVSGSR